jgi:hypothetical protein
LQSAYINHFIQFVNKGRGNLRKALGTIDWQLLVFLLLFLNVKLVVKIAAISFIYLVRTNFSFGFNLKKTRLPLFYLLIISVGIFNWIFYRQYDSMNYGMVLLTGIIFWGMSILAIHQVKLSVENNSTETIHRTIFIFLLINVIVSLAIYAGIIFETGSLNPYRYQGNYQKYFIGTGDYIKGVTFDSSTTNAVLNCFGVLYFLVRRNSGMMLLCMVVLLLTGSNASNILLCITLTFVFIFKSNKNQKSLVMICMMFLVIFMAKVSPQNNQYIEEAWQRISNHSFLHPSATASSQQNKKDAALLTAQRKIAKHYLDSLSLEIYRKKLAKKTTAPVFASFVNETGIPDIPKPNIHSPSFQHRSDTTLQQKELLAYADKHKINLQKVADYPGRNYPPGKLNGLKQTFQFFYQHPYSLLTGMGMGNFSSKLAFRVSGLKIAGGFPERYYYLHDAFKYNHLALYIFYFSKRAGLHSLTNTPNSVYDQLLSEYGIAGLLLFFVFYLGFFMKHSKGLSYGIPILFLMAGFFFMDYWFEQLSVVIFFELLLFTDIKETNERNYKIS